MLKINTLYKPPKQLPSESIFDRNDRRYVKTMGTIGAGTKVHHLILEVVDTDDGLGLLSVCGSARWNSHLAPNLNDKLVCTCERCQPATLN